MRRALLFFAILLTTTGFDFASKEWARTSLAPGARQPVIAGFWDWELARNPGAAFSTFADVPGGSVALAILAAVAAVAIGVIAARTRPEERLARASLALIAGGALGNLVDRVRDGAVTDFVRWHGGAYDWPIFNAADAALVVGVGLLALENGLAWRRRARLQT